MSDLVVIAFPTEAKAEEVRQKLLAMQKEYLIELGDAVIAVKDSKENIKLNQIDKHHYSRRGDWRLLGLAHWSNFSDAAGWCRPWRSVRHAQRIFDGCRHRRQMDEGDCLRRSTWHGSALRTGAQSHGGQGS